MFGFHYERPLAVNAGCNFLRHREDEQSGNYGVNISSDFWSELFAWIPVCIPVLGQSTPIFSDAAQSTSTSQTARELQSLEQAGVAIHVLCHGLKYESQYEAPVFRAVSQRHKLRERLGQLGSLADPFPAKPKGMRWKTYRRLAARDAALDGPWYEAFVELLERIDRRR